MEGFVMPQKYRHIKGFEKELIEYLEQGHTLRETREKFGFTYKKCEISKLDIIKTNANLRQE